jgi:hypothetical protein
MYLNAFIFEICLKIKLKLQLELLKYLKNLKLNDNIANQISIKIVSFP